MLLVEVLASPFAPAAVKTKLCQVVGIAVTKQKLSALAPRLAEGTLIDYHSKAPTVAKVSPQLTDVPEIRGERVLDAPRCTATM